MDNQASRGLQHFKNYVGIKFQLYNSLFTSLPFHRIEKTGILLSLFVNICEEGYKKKLSPTEIIKEFFKKHTSLTSQADQLDLLFRFTQFVERQVVLFDALEDAAFPHVHDTGGAGTLKQLELEVIQKNKETELAKKLEDFSIELVLTAHPTQFYPGSVLGIINDLSKSLSENNAAQINMYLQQLGKTPFFKKEKPTPYDEALSLIWYLENVFFAAAGRILSFLKSQFPDAVHENNPIIKMGFWPGGDRDGNPFVNTEITLKVADALRGGIIKCYYLEIRKLRRRLTFKGVDVLLSDLEKQLYNNIFIPGNRTRLTKNEIVEVLNTIRQTLIYQHNGLFLHLVDNLINKINVFGLHFASIDIRQDSSIHKKVFQALAAAGNVIPADYSKLSDEKKIELLSNNNEVLAEKDYKDPVINDTIESIKAIKLIQEYNGEQGCNRYIISHSSSALNVLEVYGLFILCGWKKEELNVDIVPLIETIEDLQNAAKIVRALYENEPYRQHLKQRNNNQTIMLGFSDGTKDGGYLMGNWGIYKTKEELTAVSKEYNINVVFFDGRGGPPARGGGKTHKFYASMGKNISNKEIQLTIQGQTVSSNFGTIDSAQYNIEQLIHAGISNDIFSNKSITLEKEEEALLQELADESFNAYSRLKNHPDFMDYLIHISPLKFYGETNIGSRPSKRGGSNKINFEDLRAIPFVGAWSQLKQNVTGFYGVGEALQKMEKEGKFNQLKTLYQNSLFFKTLIDNCEMAMKKCFFPLTEYLSKDEKYADIWNMIYTEYVTTEKYLFQLSGKNELMADYAVEQQSIGMREKIVLPLVTIQQFAISNIRELEEELITNPVKDIYEKLAMRCSFGIINAGRNSA
ncbi:phosphoenolpyruvate carboxylase [Ginsengibacter hankyongi]|uniref:Phosphoenolpyruvate carboxylase n=1 Tax=Ginsengibacter hankyongi TaxID=2607284 RepID=A0A5J5IIR6_9BACT|nr:phosphoenolpyruvate carboxylase [Ginsengibacter hankyongi]KAA9038129.1 phosphoenolpyruvate carboxylase [Ginsengibacter hankyongi]